MFSIGGLSRRTGVKIPTIRYYEKVGLINTPERSRGNQRQYTKQGLERLQFIRHGRQLGLTIADIRELMVLGDSPEQSCKNAHSLASRHLSSVRERISHLQKLERELKRISELTDSGQVGECQIIEAFSDHSQCKYDH